MCECEICDECKGQGYIWFSITGEYLGAHRMDDLSSMDICPECNGLRITEICEHCIDLEGGE